MPSPSLHNSAPLRPLVHSAQRTQYQFPVYRFINWIAIGSYLLGLVAMYFLLGMFGIPAPLGWAAIVIMFSFGILLLDRPKLLLNSLMFFWWFLPSNRLFGLLPLPLPGFLDELFFIPLVAVIVMHWIQSGPRKDELWYPFVFALIAGLSWYLNGKGYPFPSFRATIVTLKPFILFYYCMITCPFESDRELRRWLVLIVIFSAIQFPYNCLWQGAPWPRIHPDVSGGMFGPHHAHRCGYINIIALLLSAGWWLADSKHMTKSRKFFFLLVTLITLYNLVFMTDTKHGLLMAMVAFFPFLLHRRLPFKLKRNMFIAGLAFCILSIFYLVYSSHISTNIRRYWNTFVDSPKGDYYRAVTKDFNYLVRFPFFGAGPGRFGSDVSIDLRTPLARRFIISFLDERRRYLLSGGQTAFGGGTQLRYPEADFLTSMGEYGWLGAFVQYLFYASILIALWNKAKEQDRSPLAAFTMLGLLSTLFFLVELTFVVKPSTLPQVTYPVWILIGRLWDMKTTSGDLLPGPHDVESA